MDVYIYTRLWSFAFTHSPIHSFIHPSIHPSRLSLALVVVVVVVVFSSAGGSGVLAIAALRLGCAQALATDIDPSALAATAENAELNDIAMQPAGNGEEGGGRHGPRSKWRW